MAIVGMVLSLFATLLYARMGREAAAHARRALQANPHSS